MIPMADFCSKILVLERLHNSQRQEPTISSCESQELGHMTPAVSIHTAIEGQIELDNTQANDHSWLSIKLYLQIQKLLDLGSLV